MTQIGRDKLADRILLKIVICLILVTISSIESVSCR